MRRLLFWGNVVIAAVGLYAMTWPGRIEVWHVGAVILNSLAAWLFYAPR